MKEDWIECSLGDILTIERGGSPRPIKEFFTQDKNGVNWIKIGDATYSGKYILKTVQKIKPSGLIKTRQVFPGDLILSNSMSFGRPYIMGIKGAIHDGWLVIRDNKYLDKDFLYYALGSPTTFDQFSKKAKGSTVKNLNIGLVSDVNINLVSRVEQKAIVKKIEELFSSLDSGIADLKKAQNQLVIYRQAVLKKAFEGIKEFKSLKECGEWKGGGTPSRQVKEYWENGKIPWVSSRDVKTKEIHDTERHITEIAIPNSSTKWIEKDSLLFVMRSGILRRIFPIAIAKTKLCVNQDIQTVSLDENWNTEYVYWFLQGNESDIRHSCSKDGTTVESIDANSLKAYLVPFCSLKEQHQIVSDIESRLSVCDKVEKDITDSLEKAKALRQSILKKAFEGKLLSAEEIAKCKANAAYEPASVLLKKIKAEKEKK